VGCMVWPYWGPLRLAVSVWMLLAVIGTSSAEEALRTLIQSTPPVITGPSEPDTGTDDAGGRAYWRPNIALLPEHKLPLPFETVEWEKDIIWDAHASNIVVDSNGIVTRRRNPYVCRVVMEKDPEEEEPDAAPAIPRAVGSVPTPASSSPTSASIAPHQAAATANSGDAARATKPKWKRAVVSGSQIVLEPLERETRHVKLPKIDFSAPPGGQPAAPAAAPAVLSYPLCCPLNAELASGRWLLDVVWDAADPRYKGFSAPLVLDRNDPGVIFRDELPGLSAFPSMSSDAASSRADAPPVSSSYDSMVAFGVLCVPRWEPVLSRVCLCLFSRRACLYRPWIRWAVTVTLPPAWNSNQNRQ
jgi:hypothetical protein